MDEKYLKINKFSKYEISNFGNIKNIKNNRILKPRINNNGYYFVSLLNDKNKQQICKIHELVVKAFLIEHDYVKSVAHVDNNILNNRLDNLKYSNGGRFDIMFNKNNNVIKQNLSDEDIERLLIVKFDF